MKFTINKRLAALVLATSVAVSQFQTVVYATNSLNVNNYEVQSEAGKIIYTNDFSVDSMKPYNATVNFDDEIETSIENEMLKFKPAFTGDDKWDENRQVLKFGYNSEEKLVGATVSYDVLIPTDKLDTLGTLKLRGTVSDSGYNWKETDIATVVADNFVDNGDGLSKYTFTGNIETKIDGIGELLILIIGQPSSYSDYIYIDNFKVTGKVSSGKETPLPEVNKLKFDFSDGLDGWNFGGTWDYKKDVEVEHDTTVGDGSLKMALDFSEYKSLSWSEVKIEKKYNEEKLDFNGYNKITFDLIYETDKMISGLFKAKLFIDGVANDEGKVDRELAEDIGNGLSKIPVTIEFNAKNTEIDGITLSVIGSNTDYKGNIYIDNIELGQVKKDEVYVEKTAVTTEQKKLNLSDLDIKSSVKLVDSNASETTADLYSYLKGIGKTENVIYGHQNDTHHKAVLKDKLTNSDTKDLTGSISGMIGIDTLSLTGNELQLTEEEEAAGLTLPQKAAKLNAEAAKEGSIITMSAHMPNFALVAEKGVDENGDYDYYGYTPGVTTGNVVARIMPGGDLNEVYTGYLDMIAEYAHELAKEDVPVLFRPFHENNGSWFWWGKAFCDEEAYKNLFRYTVEYLRDDKEINNFLYVYSPNGPFVDEADYLSRYPGDEFIDIIAFDMYHDNPSEDASTDPWMSTLKETIELVQGIADEKGKLAALSETGIRINYGCMPVSGNANKQWFQNVSDIVGESSMPYFMSWANFDEGNVFAPYMVSETKGHEMINEFIDYYNEDSSIFADGNANFAEANTSVEEAYSYGFITSPTSGSRVLNPTTITASVKNVDEKISFVIRDSEGKKIKTLKAVEEDGVFKADIDQKLLDKIGETIGTIELVGNKEKEPLNTINVIFNIEESEEAVNLVDDFESYMGEEALLKQKWTTDQGAGCSVSPTLTTELNEHNNGTYGLAFNYKINTSKISEGYAGITKNLENDWSQYDALRLWINPDGQGQKLVIQVRSYGQDFEWYLNDFVAGNEAKELTLKFEELTPKNEGAIFDPSSIERFAIYCNTVDNADVDSTIYFDNIRAVDSSKVEDTVPTPDEDENKPTEPVKPDNGGNNGNNANNGNGNSGNGNNKLPQTGGVNSAIAVVAALGALVGGIGLTKRKKND